ncbi:MAG: HAD family hydrolase [Pseudomonadota bacterium]
MTSTIHGVIFDKDGTLFDFDKTWGPVTGQMIRDETVGDAAQESELAKVLGFDLANDRFFPGSLVIASTADVVEAAVLPFTRDKDLDALRARMRAATSSVPQVAVGDLSSLFSDMASAGLTLGIATNDAEAPARANLAQFDLEQHFAFIAGMDTGFGSKPEPGQLMGFCNQTGISPANCVMVGDSLHDLHAGRSAGMATVGVLTGPAAEDELAPYADVVLGSIMDLPAWLDQR